MPPPEFIFLRDGIGRFDDQNDISSGLHEILLIYAGSWRQAPTAKTEFIELAETGQEAIAIKVREFRDDETEARLNPIGKPGRKTIAALIRGKVQTEIDLPAKDSKEESADEKTNSDSVVKLTKETELNVVLVSDIDCLLDEIFRIRLKIDPNMTADFEWEFQNVTFVLNIIDVLADKEHPFVDIRKRRRVHRKLTEIDKRTIEADKKASEKRKEFREEFKNVKKSEEKRIMAGVRALEKKKDSMEPQQYRQLYEIQDQAAQRRLAIRVTELIRDRDKDIEEIDRIRDDEIRVEQDKFKVWALLIPPILPFVMGCFVFFHRRSMEREGVSNERLR